MDSVTLDEISYLSCFLPEQLCSMTSTAPNCFEVNLMRAIFEDALNCWLRSRAMESHAAQRLGREAEAWFFSNEDNWLFSFVNICNVLGIDPGYIRRGLNQLKHSRSTDVPIKIKLYERRGVKLRLAA